MSLRFEPSFLRTRVARRVFALFIACAILPVVALSAVAFGFVSTQIERQSKSQLRQIAKSTAMTAFERLTEREAELSYLAARGREDLSRTMSEGSWGKRLRERYRGLYLVAPDAPPQRILSSETGRSSLPDLSLAEPPSMILGPDRGVFLVVPAADGGTLVAELDLRRLLEPDQGMGYAGSDQFLVLDDRGDLLYASRPLREEFVSAALGGGLDPHSGTFAWATEGEEHLAASWMLFLQGRFGAAPWRFVVSQPRVEIFSMAEDFKLTFFLVALLCLSVAFLASATQIRRTMRPLDILREATERISRGDYSARVETPLEDEFSLLSRSFNEMSARVDQQFEEIRAARDAAERASLAKSEFLALMSHEVRTPMNGILAMAEIALATEDESERRDCLETIRSSTDSLAHVLRDVLDFSSVERGEVPIVDEPFDASRELGEATRLYRAAAEERGLNLDIQIDTAPGLSLVGDAARLRQVLSKLLDNAMKFTDRGGVAVLIEAENLDDDRALLTASVEDTGVGISEDKLRLIFDSFTQAETFMSRSYSGTGLGLATAKGLIERMGGRIWAESSVGSGSAFHVEIVLPVARKHEAAREATESSGDGARANLHGLRALVAEDNAVNQKVAERMLRREGLEVTIAANGQEAVDLLLAETFDVILMDLQMPVLDGLEATRIIRERLPELSCPPVIAFTAHVAEHDANECLAAGMADFLTKPLSRDALVATLERHLLGAHRDRQRESLSEAPEPVTPA